MPVPQGARRQSEEGPKKEKRQSLIQEVLSFNTEQAQREDDLGADVGLSEDHRFMLNPLSSFKVT